MRAEDLLALGHVDRLTPENPDGYQRELRRQRLYEVARYVTEEEGLFPGSIITAIRKENDWSFKSDGSVGGVEAGTLSLTDVATLEIIDGQNRVYGIEHAINQADDKGAEELRNMVLPVVVLPDVTKLEEMRVFFIVNDRQKAVPTDLVDHLLLESLTASRPTTARERARAQATEIAAFLAREKGGPWYQRIKLPDEPALKAYQLKLHPFVASLQEHLAPGGILETYARENTDTAARVISNYWEGIRSLLPEAFESPEDYSLMRTPGLYSLHMLFPDVLRLVEQDGTATPERFATILDDVRLLKHAHKWSTKEKEKADPMTLGTNMRLLRMLRDDMKADLPRPRLTL